MRKEKIIRKLKSQKGITAADITMSLIIILATVSVIGMIYTNLTFTSRKIDRKAIATNIATKILEGLNSLYYDDIDSKLAQSNVSEQLYGRNIPSGYSVNIRSNNFSEISGKFVKNVLVTVMYKWNGNNQEFTLTRTFEKELVRETNSPKFELLENMSEFAGYSMILYSKYILAPTGNYGYVICPIKENDGNYSIVTDENEIWYSYSNKRWAKTLVLTPAECETYINSTTGTISSNNVFKFAHEDKLYVWIPRYGMDLDDVVHFKYKNTNNAIQNSVNKNDTTVYYYINTDMTTWWTTSHNLCFDSANNTDVGLWQKYSDIYDETKEAGILNNSDKYGPFIIY